MNNLLRKKCAICLKEDSTSKVQIQTDTEATRLGKKALFQKKQRKKRTCYWNLIIITLNDTLYIYQWWALSHQHHHHTSLRWARESFLFFVFVPIQAGTSHVSSSHFSWLQPRLAEKLISVQIHYPIQVDPINSIQPLYNNIRL